MAIVHTGCRQKPFAQYLRPTRPQGREFTSPLISLAFSKLLAYHRRRTGGRVVDGTALEMRRTCKGSVGSNPTLSASLTAILKPRPQGTWSRWTRF